MKHRYFALLISGLCLVTSAVGQAQTAIWTPPETLKGPCPNNPESKTAWFDPSKYLMRGNGVKVGSPISHPDPEYAESARKAKIQGAVVMALAINAGGTVDEVKVVCKLEPGLDQNAVAAVKQWKFTPATKDATPVPVQIEVSMEYRLY